MSFVLPIRRVIRVLTMFAVVTLAGCAVPGTPLGVFGPTQKTMADGALTTIGHQLHGRLFLVRRLLD